MKDYLEETVEAKYYINSEKAQQLIDRLISSSTIPSRAEQSRADALTLQSTNQRTSMLQTAYLQELIEASATTE
jgi:hypothetical protein